MRRMTKRRERMRPDTRPHWDDPDLKVVGPDGELYTAEEISEAHQECMQFNRAPTWRRDPSYAWRERAIKFREARAAAIAKQQKIDDSKKLVARKESTEGVERVVLREGIEGTERADHVESTARDERAATIESTVNGERAANGESAEKSERGRPLALKPAGGLLPPIPPPKSAPRPRKRRKSPSC